MSKCDLQIVFDQSDRTYRGGDQITGSVYVQVNQDVSSNGVVLEHCWQTHGRGNTATGPKQRIVLYQGDLRAGQSLRYPFRLTAPDGPPTYHGHYLNIDHYVHVRVDIPWAIDPKLKEDYILLPGSGWYGNLPLQSLPGARETLKQNLKKLGAPVGVVLILFGLVFLPCGLILIPAGLFVLFLSLRRLLAEKRIGQVTLSWGPLNVAPGGSVPLRLAFTPRKSSRLNQITAKLVGMERCVSGSGTNRTTHTHKLHERTVPLASEGDVTAYQPFHVEGSVPVPDTGAFSFSASDNQILWELEVRVDIPRWPDWVEKRAVIVRPAAEAEPAEVTLVEEPAAVPGFGQPVPDAAIVEELPEETAAGAPLPGAAVLAEGPGPGDQPPAPASAGPALAEIVERIRSARRYSRQREEIIEKHSERSFDCSIEVSKVERTFSYVPDERFRDGRTVTGVIPGTDCKVCVQLTGSRNDELDGLQPGSRFRAACKLLKWNTIYDRLEMREA